jgi:hypothetical protein
MAACLIELHYLPGTEFFSAIAPFRTIVLEGHEHFIKQTYRNRCLINTAQGVRTLIVPVARGSKMALREVEIDYRQRWQNNHWRTIESAYRKAPFFEFYADEVRAMIYSAEPRLFDLNKKILSFCLQTLRSTATLAETTSYEMPPPAGVRDLRNALAAKKSTFRAATHAPLAYPQVFGSAFVPGLSFIDLLFCTGPQAARYTRQAP